MCLFFSEKDVSLFWFTFCYFWASWAGLEVKSLVGEIILHSVQTSCRQQHMPTSKAESCDFQWTTWEKRFTLSSKMLLYSQKGMGIGNLLLKRYLVSWAKIRLNIRRSYKDEHPVRWSCFLVILTAFGYLNTIAQQGDLSIGAIYHG